MAVKIKIVMCAVSIGMAGLFACEANGAESFRWMLHAEALTNTYSIADIPADGVYSVRFRAALMNAIGGVLKVRVDGVEYECRGNGFVLTGAREHLGIPGEVDVVNYGLEMRNRRYHDFVFVSTPREVCLFGDGDEKTPVVKKASHRRMFEIVGEKTDLDVAGLEFERRDMRGKWTCRNQIVNGGFEELNNGYPVSWSTYNFGFGNASEVADLEQTRANYRIDEDVAYEGHRSMRLACQIPLWECWRMRLSRMDYVYSFYAKAEKPGTALLVQVFEGEQNALVRKTVYVDGVWRRFCVPFRTQKGAGLRCGVRATVGSVVWIDACQLERGQFASPFVPRGVLSEDLPPDPPKVMDHFYTDSPSPKAPSRHKPRMSSVNPRRNSFVVDGKEYFAFGIHGQRGWFGDIDTCRRVYDRFVEWGLNFYEWGLSGEIPEDAETVKDALDELQKRGIKTMLYLPYSLKDGRFAPKQFRLIKQIARHPNVLGIGSLDELYGRITNEKRHELVGQLRSEIGSDIPVQINDFDLGVINHMDFSDADIASLDVYAIGVREISSLYYILKQFRDEHPDEVLMYYPMASGHYAMWYRDPTPTEVLAQAYIGYVLEVFNIKWWAVTPLTPDVMPAVALARRERDIICPSAFLDGKPLDLSCSCRNDAVKFAARAKGDNATIVAINIERLPHEVKWTFSEAPRKVRSLVGKNPIDFEGRTVRDSFGPLERRVYEIDL